MFHIAYCKMLLRSLSAFAWTTNSTGDVGYEVACNQYNVQFQGMIQEMWTSRFDLQGFLKLIRKVFDFLA